MVFAGFAGSVAAVLVATAAAAADEDDAASWLTAPGARVADDRSATDGEPENMASCAANDAAGGGRRFCFATEFRGEAWGDRAGA